MIKASNLLAFCVIGVTNGILPIIGSFTYGKAIETMKSFRAVAIMGFFLVASLISLFISSLVSVFLKHKTNRIIGSYVVGTGALTPA